MIWLPLALISAFTAALVAIFGKIGVAGIDSAVATMLRAAFMFLILLVFVLASGRFGHISAISGRSMLFIVISGAVGALSWLMYFWALKVGDASKVVPIDRLSLLFAVAIAAIFLGEKLGWKSGVGAVLMVAGSLLIVAK